MTRLPGTSTNCPRCGGRLARDNASGRCAGCQAAERDRLVAPPTVSASFWTHEPIRRALAERHLGRVIRAYRCHPYHGRHPLPQRTVASWLGITQAQLSRVENGPAMVHLDRLTHWAQLLRIPGDRLWFALPDLDPGGAPGTAGMTGDRRGPDQVGAESAATSVPDRADTVVSAFAGGGDTTNRRRFAALATLAGIGVSGSFDLLGVRTELPRTVGMEQVNLAGALVDEFRRADAAVGADALCDIAVQVHTHLSSWAADVAFSRPVGDVLQAVLASLATQVAWLAIDADRRAEARPYLHEAISRARIADDPREEVRALACLSLLIRKDRPGEALQCAEAALRIAAGWATPRLTTLLHLRSAYAYATLRDAGGVSREMTKARRDLDRGTHEDDQPFLQFVNAQEVSGIEGLSYLALGRPDRASDSFRSVVASPSLVNRRNHVYYTVCLAKAASRKGDVNQAARTALAVLPSVSGINSTRVSRLLAGIRSDLAHSRQATAATREFVDAYDRVAAR
jgi:hypothetical protein